MDTLNLQKVHFCGISLGGMVGQMLGAKHGERIHSLILCDTSSHMPPPEQWDERIALIRRSGTAILADRTIDRWFTQSGQERLKTVVEKCRQMILDTPPDGYCGCGAAIRDLDLREAIRTISTRTLIIVGEQDEATPVAAAEFIRDWIATSSLKVIPDAAHLVNVEQAELFNAALLDFLRACP
jgi:3-oxoadipate enol-lactonase